MLLETACPRARMYQSIQFLAVLVRETSPGGLLTEPILQRSTLAQIPQEKILKQAFNADRRPPEKGLGVPRRESHKCFVGLIRLFTRASTLRCNVSVNHSSKEFCQMPMLH